MIVNGILRMAVILDISDRTLRKALQKHPEFPVDKSEAGHWIFDTDKVLPWWKQHYGYLEGFHNGSLITANGLKKKLGVSHGTVSRWMYEGMPHQKVNPSLIVIDLEEAAKWLAKHSESTKIYSERLEQIISSHQNENADTAHSGLRDPGDRQNSMRV
ncbi:hypothetical protein [Paenibacillus barengoltzii]|uniref:hypothetical protein n=1 Tax=Paenibacillus barengoltzii TaxID=343517 RepID=UPI003879B812